MLIHGGTILIAHFGERRLVFGARNLKLSNMLNVPQLKKYFIDCIHIIMLSFSFFQMASMLDMQVKVNSFSLELQNKYFT